MNKWKIQISANNIEDVKNYEYDLLDNGIQVNISTEPVKQDDKFSLSLLGDKANFNKLSAFLPNNAEAEIYILDIWADNISYYHVQNHSIISSWKENISGLYHNEAVDKFYNYGFQI